MTSKYEDMPADMQADFDNYVDSIDWEAEIKAHTAHSKKMAELSQAWDTWAHHTFGSTRTALHKIGQMSDRLYRPNIKNLDTFKEMYGMK